MRFKQVKDWLHWQESLHTSEIALGLGRVKQVLAQANLPSKFNCPLITVAGTNGKGSVVALLETIAFQAGLKVCSYTSPHLIHYNERIKTNIKPITDEQLCQAFADIDQARQTTSLSYFEFGTLAAIRYFFTQKPDLVILEVGLGGRLDAVNIMQNDLSIITSIAIDHINWLGNNTEAIGFEKAGIFKQDKPVICGELNVPKSIVEQAKKMNAKVYQLGKNIKIKSNNNTWQLDTPFASLKTLQNPALSGEFQKQNAALAITALQQLDKKFTLFSSSNLTTVQTSTLTQNTINKALTQLDLLGRFTKINSQPDIIVDVAHNPHAAKALAAQLKKRRKQDDRLDKDIQLKKSKTWAIVAMLKDKDVSGVIKNCMNEIDNWCFAGLDNVPHGLSVMALFNQLPIEFFSSILTDNKEINWQENTPINNKHMTDELSIKIAKNQCTMVQHNVYLAEDVKKAYALVLEKLNTNDRLIIFGSFYTVAQIIK